MRKRTATSSMELFFGFGYQSRRQDEWHPRRRASIVKSSWSAAFMPGMRLIRKRSVMLKRRYRTKLGDPIELEALADRIQEKGHQGKNFLARWGPSRATSDTPHRPRRGRRAKSSAVDGHRTLVPSLNVAKENSPASISRIHLSTSAGKQRLGDVAPWFSATCRRQFLLVLVAPMHI